MEMRDNLNSKNLVNNWSGFLVNTKTFFSPYVMKQDQYLQETDNGLKSIFKRNIKNKITSAQYKMKICLNRKESTFNPIYW